MYLLHVVVKATHDRGLDFLLHSSIPFMTFANVAENEFAPDFGPDQIGGVKALPCKLLPSILSDLSWAGNIRDLAFCSLRAQEFHDHRNRICDSNFIPSYPTPYLRTHFR